MENSLYEGIKEQLHYHVYTTRAQMGKFSAHLASERIRKLLETQAEVRIVFAAAPSQDEFLHYLTNDSSIDWSRIVGFHMDEYVGLPSAAEQWFKNYLQKAIVDKVNLKSFHFINGENEPEEEIRRYSALLKESAIDMVCLGIGENGHIAFNDPPVADFDDPEVMKMVELDHACRQQQVNDGCFSSLHEVPTHAMTLTIPTLMNAGSLICTVPGPTKRKAVNNMLNHEISTACPASILRKHKDAHLVLDKEAFGGN